MLRYVSIARASRSLGKFSAIIHIVTDDTVQHERAKRAGSHQCYAIENVSSSVAIVSECNDLTKSLVFCSDLCYINNEGEFSSQTVHPLSINYAT